MIDILLEAECYVEDLLRQSLPVSRCFHTFRHTKSVVEAAEQIAETCQVPWIDSEALFLAAWFHATGYSQNNVDHINESIIIASNFLDVHESPDGLKLQVTTLLRSARKGVSPSSHLERILRDALGYFLGSPYYFIFSQLARQELQWCEAKTYTDQEWANIAVRWLENHHYYTPFAKQSWDAQKSENLKMLASFVAR